MQKLVIYPKLRMAFFILSFILVFLNFISLLQIYPLTLTANQSRKNYEPGMEFADFKEKLSGVKRVGFLTNKDMSPERNDGQFLAAQGTLAPIILDLNNPNHSWIILDCIHLIPAYLKMKEIDATPVYTNKFGKILAHKKP